MAAAVADFRPAAPEAASSSARAAATSSCAWSRRPTSSPRAAANRRPGQTIVGFAAEHGGDWVERARSKLERKGLDAVVVNDVSRSEIGFESERNEVTIVEADAATEVPIAAKEEVADAILDRVEALRSAGGRVVQFAA